MKDVKITPVAGESVASFLRRVGSLSSASKRGVQRKVGKLWEDIPLSYTCKGGDSLRVKSASGRSSNAVGLREIASMIVEAQKR